MRTPVHPGKMTRMGDPARSLKPATLEELLALAGDERGYELIGGELVQRAMTSGAHARSVNRLGGRIGDPFDRPPGRRGPGGWWILTDPTVEFSPTEIYRPDIAGWRRDRVPHAPSEFPVRIRPDWVCEVLSPSNSTNDTIKKRHTYHRCQVPHYWILDPMQETLTILRWTPDGYLIAGDAMRGQRLRAEPFEAVEIDLDELFGDVAE
ncbi:Uma2 family endonuclease [Polyangium sp. 6x1]|uniref:Uma2 family endonuclease n=1 Tax=Polyangium sp. 6x1 TaxID=3042689 RepID=UPI002482DEB5|nr:Uma2 family endonuclease [Polyangium sp. 6x1]MDI1444278.1 Uma2 family endonuclease [Polyangium sp. 6x1]